MQFVKYYDNVLPEEYCQSIIDRFESHTEEQKQSVLEHHRSFTEINLNHYPEWSDIVNTLLNTMQSYLGRYMIDCQIDQKSWPEQVGYEEFRMKRYIPNTNDEFQFHTDVVNYATARRFLVFFFYLNNVAEGGETAFQQHRELDILERVQPKAGRLLMFPPLWTHPHIGIKPISNTKYILGSYLHYI